MNLEDALIDSISFAMTPLQQSIRDSAERFARNFGRDGEGGRPGDLGLDALAGDITELGFARSEFPAVLIAEELGAGDAVKALELLLPLPALWFLAAAGRSADFDRCLQRWSAGLGGPGLAIQREQGGQARLWTLSATPAEEVVLVDVQEEGVRVDCLPASRLAGTISPVLGDGPLHLTMGRGDPLHTLSGDCVDRDALASACGETVQLFSAILVGAMRCCTEAAYDYADQRKSFGRPISHHQAVAIRLADTLIACQGAELLLHRIASVESGRDREDARLLSGQVAAASRIVFRDALQVFAAHGYIAESLAAKNYRVSNALVAMIDAIAAIDG
ncbi:hypothetical protein LWE61_11750 [Sphingobium sufflavum]|uniref:acyl-CoA dehydrogenase family protein n=1 Tax=Sphingobium sufflavum TaxID=1129547 RepID=UPI001F34A306|nr:acyl-CoA dehydrogenase family protein [Sphingobium sufflavum]MCE7797231.1 hypothetical protein [Sphingobium sufflavum]